jgi:hypothetical protein
MKDRSRRDCLITTGAVAVIGAISVPRCLSLPRHRPRHPELDRLPASEAVAHIIAWAAREHAAWFWRGVGLPERR